MQKTPQAAVAAPLPQPHSPPLPVIDAKTTDQEFLQHLVQAKADLEQKRQVYHKAEQRYHSIYSHRQITDRIVRTYAKRWIHLCVCPMCGLYIERGEVACTKKHAWHHHGCDGTGWWVVSGAPNPKTCVLCEHSLSVQI